MGMSTNFELQHNKDDLEVKDSYSSSLKQVLKYGENLMKWYDHHGDMVKLSQDNPDAEFYLYGVGEYQSHDVLDIWIKFYTNGVLKSHRVAKPDFYEKVVAM